MGTTIERATGGLAWGTLGVALFSMSLPASRVAVEAFDPVFVGAARGALAGLLALAVLAAGRAGWPARRDWPLLAVVGLGVVLGFPLLTTVAVAKAGAIHGAILTGLLPAGTAVAGVILARERPSLLFWLAAGAGLLCVLGFAAVQARVGRGRRMGCCCWPSCCVRPATRPAPCWPGGWVARG